MSRSGYKRGLAYSAVTAMAITGLPFFAGSASAVPMNQQIAAEDVALLTPTDGSTASTQNDGVNSTIHLVANGGTGVAEVTFQYSINGVNFFDIATVSRTEGVFSTEWAPPANLNNTTVTLRAVGTGAGDGSDTSGVTITPAAESIDIANAPGSAVGVFQQPYSTVGQDRDLGVVSGTTSEGGSNPNVEVYASDGHGGMLGAVTTEDTASGSMWSAAVDFSGYVYGTNAATRPDQAVVIAEDESEDGEAVTLYKQTVTTVTAAAADSSIQNGESTAVTVTVEDQNGKPVAGAEVVWDKDNNGAINGADEVEYTDSQGEATFDSVPSGTSTFYVNTTDNDAYENGTDFKRTTTVSQYNPVATTVEAVSRDGAVIDRDELDSDDFQVIVKDQQGEPIEGATVQYTWAGDPFADGVANSTESGAATDTDNDGRIDIPAPSSPASGSYTLTYYVNQDGTPGQGAGDLAGTPLTVKIGESEIVFDEVSPQQAALGGSETVSGSLQLEDGTGLPGRPILLSTTGGDARFDQASGADQATYSTVTDADGNFTSTLDSPNGDTSREDNTVTAETADWTHNGDVDNAGETATTDVEFIYSTTPGSVTTTPASTVEETAGELQEVDVCVESQDNPATTGVDESEPLTNQEVALTTDHGYFTDGHPATPAVGDYVGGVYDNDGQSKTYTTDDTGCVTVQLSIGRDEDFDDDGEVAATVTATAGSASDSSKVNWTSENPINAGEVTIDFADDDQQDSSALPNARFDLQTVDLVVMAFDQFGNRVGGETVNLTDNAGNWTVDPSVVTDYDDESDATADSSQAGAQNITATWTEPSDKYVADGPDAGTALDTQTTATQTDTISINWYEIDFAASTYTIENDTAGTAKVNEGVTETVTVVDQFGQAIEGVDVKFVRSGPNGQSDTDTVTTDQNGEAVYNFTSGSAGNAQITAYVENFDGQQVKELTDTVTFTQDAPPVVDIEAELLGASNGKAADQLTVNAPDVAADAVVKLFKIKKDGSRKLVGEDVLNDKGNRKFTVADKNGKKFTKYVAVVKATDAQNGATSNNKKVR